LDNLEFAEDEVVKTPHFATVGWSDGWFGRYSKTGWIQNRRHVGPRIQTGEI